MKYIWILVLGILIFRFYFYYSSDKPYKDGDRVRITCSVTSEPIYYDKSQIIVIKGLKIILPKYPEVSYGDILTIEGVVVYKDRGKWELANAKLNEIKKSKNFLYNFRESLVSFIMQSLPPTDAALIAGVTIGSKSSIPKGFWEALKASGTAHVVVASGMNVTLVAKFLIGIFAVFMTRKKGLVLALIGVWLYALIAGFDAPIIRAAVMGTIAFTAQELGKVGHALRALLFAAVIMLLVKPDWIGDAGFQLSFLATLSLIVFEKRVREYFHFLPHFIRDNMSTSTAAQIGVAPVLFLNYGQFNLLSPIINAMVLWTVVPMTVIGVLGGVVGLIIVPLGQVILWLSIPLTQWFTGVISLMSNVPN